MIVLHMLFEKSEFFYLKYIFNPTPPSFGQAHSSLQKCIFVSQGSAELDQQLQLSWSLLVNLCYDVGIHLLSGIRSN